VLPGLCKIITKNLYVVIYRQPHFLLDFGALGSVFQVVVEKAAGNEGLSEFFKRDAVAVSKSFQ